MGNLFVFSSFDMQKRNLQAVERVLQAVPALSGLSLAINQTGPATGSMMISFIVWLL